MRPDRVPPPRTAQGHEKVEEEEEEKGCVKRIPVAPFARARVACVCVSIATARTGDNGTSERRDKDGRGGYTEKKRGDDDG